MPPQDAGLDVVTLTKEEKGEAYRRLACAVLVQAITDAQGRGYKMKKGDREKALQWLRSRRGIAWADALDMADELKKWLQMF